MQSFPIVNALDALALITTPKHEKSLPIFIEQLRDRGAAMLKPDIGNFDLSM